MCELFTASYRSVVLSHRSPSSAGQAPATFLVFSGATASSREAFRCPSAADSVFDGPSLTAEAIIGLRICVDFFEVNGRAVIAIEGDLCFAASDTSEQREEVRGYLPDAAFLCSIVLCRLCQ